MMRQLHIVPNIAVSFGGLGMAALRYAESISQAGAEVTLLTASNNAEVLLQPFSESKYFRIVHIPSGFGPRASLLEQYRSIEALCGKNDFDIMHLHGVWAPLFYAAASIARKRNIPYIVSPHGSYEPWAINHKRLKKYLALVTYQRAINRSAAMFFATADQEVESIRCLNIKQPIAMIPNGVDIEVPHARAIRRGKNTILFLSRISPKKGLLDLVKAWAQVRDPNWRIMIAGPDEKGHQAVVEAVIKDLHLTSDFEFVGMVSGARKRACFAQADIFVLPTYSENFGIAIAEALMNELPVITTTGTPWRDIEKHRCGWWVSPGVEGISKALVAAMRTEPAELRSMGERGRQLVMQKYSWNGVGRDALSAYEWLLNRTPMPSTIRTG